MDTTAAKEIRAQQTTEQRIYTTSLIPTQINSSNVVNGDRVTSCPVHLVLFGMWNYTPALLQIGPTTQVIKILTEIPLQILLNTINFTITFKFF